MDRGIAVNREHMWALAATLGAKKVELARQVACYVPASELEEFVAASDEPLINVESALQISKLLFSDLKIGARLKLKTTKSGDRLSTGKKQLEALKRQHPVIPVILEYREASKLGSMIVTILEAARQEGDLWVVHGEIVTTRADTGRLAMRHPNLQNVPTRTAEGREVRAGFVARPGMLLISVDYSQIELRLLAHAAQEPNMLRIFREGGDIHLDTAMRAFGISDPKKVDKHLHRAPCKNVNFGIGYGLSASGLFDQMVVTFATANLPLPKWLTIDWCTTFIEAWFALYPKARDYFDLQHYRARRYGIVWTMFGRVKRVPQVRSCHARIREEGLRQAGNMPIQGDAADVFKIGMARVERLLAEWRAMGVYAEALLPIHDELLIEADEKWADTIRVMVEVEMARALVDSEGVLHSRCPILAEGSTMSEWRKAA